MNLTTKLLLTALCLTAACDPRVQRLPSSGGVDGLAPPPKSAEGDDCAGCYKWSAKPPGGVNGPPWSN